MKMFKMMRISAYLLAITILISACKFNTEPQDADPTGTTADTINQEVIKEEIKEVVYKLPTPFEFAQLLEEIGAEYIPDVLHDPSVADKYMTERAKALNLGIYGADLGYATTYEMQQTAQGYMLAIKSLLDELNVDVDYNFLQVSSVTEDFTDKDTIVRFVTQTFYETYHALNENNSPELAVLMASGLWIEGLYIAMHISEDTYNNTEIVSLLFNQSQTLNRLLDVMRYFESNEQVKEILVELVAIKNVYDKAGDSLTREEYEIIMRAVEDARAKITA